MATPKYIVRQFPKKDLQALAGFDSETLEWVEGPSAISTTRWSVHYEGVFQDKVLGETYATSYSRAATENQDERPYEYDGDFIECTRVEKRSVTVEKFFPVEAA